MLTKLSNLVIATFLILLMLEVSLRVFWKPIFLDPKFKRDDIGWAEKHVVLNRFGYRDTETELAKRFKDRRVYFLGDSFTYGWYLDDPASSLPEIFGKLAGIEVINASRPGFSLSDKLYRLKNEGILFNPDIVIVAMNLDDFVEKEFPPGYTNNKFIKSLRIYQFTVGNYKRARVKKLTEEELEKTFKDGSPALQRAEADLNDLSSLSRAVGAIPVALVFPDYDPQNPNEPYKYNNYHKVLARVLDESGITMVDLENVFGKETNKRSLFLNEYDWHPSLKANSIGAAYLKDSLMQKGLFEVAPKYFDINSKVIGPGVVLPQPTVILKTEQPWVYFDYKNTNGIQNLFLTDAKDKEINFIEDGLKTTKNFSQSGWVGAKLEHYVWSQPKLVLKNRLYGYNVAGIGQITGYWRDDGGLMSKDLGPFDFTAIRDSEKIDIEINNSEKYEYFKLTLDLYTKQFDIDSGRVKDFTSTIEKEKISDSDTDEVFVPANFTLSSLSKFRYGTSDRGYVWVDGKFAFVDFIVHDGILKIKFTSNVKKNAIITIPISIGLMPKESKTTIIYSKI